MILGIDTTGKKLKLGLALDSSIKLREVSDQPKHAQHILPEILALLKEHQKSLEDLSALAFSQGPGSFTGLRIGLGVVQGLAYGVELAGHTGAYDVCVGLRGRLPSRCR